MTKRQAVALEALCEKLVRQAIGEDVEVDMTWAGRLRFTYDDGAKKISFNKDLKTVGWIDYKGAYTDFLEEVEEIIACMTEYESDFKLLVWSYDNKDKLEND